MLVIKKNLKKILGLVSIGVVLVGIIIGISVKDKNNSKDKSAQTYNSSKNQTSPNLDTKVNNPKKICKDFFEENEKEAALKGYSKEDTVNCSFIGCGGLF